MAFDIDGNLYEFGDKNVVLYPVSKLLAELKKVGYKRTPQTIRLWERTGVIPPTIFRVGNKRLYSQDQIDAYVRVAVECDIRQGKQLPETGFSERIWEELKEVHARYE